MPMKEHQTPETPSGPPTGAYPPGTFRYGGVCFAGATLDPTAQEIRLPKRDLSDALATRLTRRELQGLATFCEAEIVRRAPGPAVVFEGTRQPLAHYLLGQIQAVLAGGPREF